MLVASGIMRPIPNSHAVKIINNAMSSLLSGKNCIRTVMIVTMPDDDTDYRVSN